MALPELSLGGVFSVSDSLGPSPHQPERDQAVRPVRFPARLH
jgi:hypothetical protein